MKKSARATEPLPVVVHAEQIRVVFV